MQDDLLIQGLELMLFGMTAVGLFLTLLVFAVILSSRIMARWFPQPQLPARRPGGRSAPAADNPSPEVVAAIAAALHRHRSQRSSDHV